MKKILILILIVFSKNIYSQKFKKLNNKIYDLKISENPFNPVKILKKNNNGEFEEVNLKKGKYKIYLQEDNRVCLTFSTNKNSIIKKGELKFLNTTTIIKNGIYYKSNSKKHGNTMRANFSSKDSILTIYLKDKNNFLKMKKEVYHTKKKLKEYKEIKFNKDGSYSISKPCYIEDISLSYNKDIYCTNCYDKYGKTIKCESF